MCSNAHLGRAGRLALALVVGGAIMTGWSSGLAWADEPGDSSGSAVSGQSSGADPATPKSGATSAPSTTNADTVTGDSTKGDSTKEEDDVRPEEGSAPASTTPDDEAAAPPSTGADGGPSREPAASKGSDRRPVNAAQLHSSAPDSNVAGPKRDAVPAATARTEQAIDATERVDATPLRMAQTQSVPVAVPDAAPVAVPDAEPTVGSTPPEPSRPDAVGVVSRLVSGIVSAILNPFAASTTPGAPAETPTLWSLLAFARREFEKVFAGPALTDTPGDPRTTSETLAEPGQRTLILTAFPAEADAILARTTLDPNPTVVVDGRSFYLGSIGGKKVIVAMTGIGMVNATDTTETALSHFTPASGISIGAVVFAGVAGGSGRTEIGSVAVPARWTADDGATWRPVDTGMLAAANTLTVDLESTATLGDPLCLCSPLARLPLVDLGREPQLFVGGDGSSDDNNNGVAFPAIPFAGDVFGPQPCTAPDRSLLFTGNFFQALGPFLAQGLLSNLTGFLAPVVPPVDAVDQETAAAQQVADAYGIPFLGIRGMSDGPGDPLNLPGYPFSFFVYRQIAADNAAIVTEAFLTSWDGA